MATSVPAFAASDIITDPDMACRLAHARDGAWVKTGFLRKCLTLDNDNKILATLNDSLMRQAEAITKQIKTVEDRYVEMEETARLWEKQARALDRINRELEASLGKWHRQPAAVALIGFSAGALVATFTVLAVNNMETGL